MSPVGESHAPAVDERRGHCRSWCSAALLGIGLAVLTGLLLRTFVVGAVRVPSRSMEATILPGDHVLVNKLVASRPLLLQFPFAPPHPLLVTVPGVRPLRVGDVLVIRPPGAGAQQRLGRDVFFLKRCVGTPGDTLTFHRTALSVNGQRVIFPATAVQRQRPGLLVESDVPVTVIVPPDTYYMLGDNPEDSADSRVWGPVPYTSIVGSAVMIYWSVLAVGDGGPEETGSRSVRWDRIGVMIR